MFPPVWDQTYPTKEISMELLNTADPYFVQLKEETNEFGATEVTISFRTSKNELDRVLSLYKPKESEPIKEVFLMREPKIWMATGKQYITRVILTCKKKGVISLLEMENIPVDPFETGVLGKWIKKPIVEKRVYTFDDLKRKGDKLVLCLNEDRAIEKVKVVVKRDRKS